MAASPVSHSSTVSSPSSSPATAPAKRSVKELLAQLSDSDSEDVQPSGPLVSKATGHISALEEDDQSSDEDVLVGGGRLAARLAGMQDGPVSSGTTLELEQSTTEQELQQSPERKAALTATNQPFQPKRKLLLKRKRPIEDDEVQSPQRNRVISREPSPSPVHSASPKPLMAISGPSSSPSRGIAETAGKSKFQALVEKARKERLAREEAENAKKAAREAQQSNASPKRRGQRGSSPADDSEEDSDRSEVAAAKRLTKDARPTRKASRRAVEEMNRETQRMNRNMQLAHQAKTKKKFTKESFFASFSHHLPKQPSDPSSAPSSDSEAAKLHSTPPTSPLLSPGQEKPMIVPQQQPADSRQIDDDSDDAPDLHALVAAKRAEEAAKEQLTARPEASVQDAARVSLNNPAQVDQDTDSGSDLEVVFDRGHKRKFAAFENLPKRKAKETGSHLALRTLAKIQHAKDKKSKLSRAEMGPSLFLAARKQAQEERQAKIEKLKAAGVLIQTAEEKEQEEEELEDLVERARQEDEEIRKREKELAKKEGTYQKDALDDDDSDEEDEDFQDDDADEARSGSEEDDDADDEDGGDDAEDHELEGNALLDEAAEEATEEEASETEEVIAHGPESDAEDLALAKTPAPSRTTRKSYLVVDDDDNEEDNAVQHVDSPALPSARKTPQSIIRSARKIIPGLQHSDDLPMGLSQAFAATMADSQTQDNEAGQEQDSMDILRDLPSPQIGIVPRLNRLESLDLISESIAGSQTQPLDLHLSLSQSQRVPESPAMLSQAGFEPTQDGGYEFSPFAGDRFTETPSKEPHSTVDTIILPGVAESPILQRKGRLQRGRQASLDDDDESAEAARKSAFQVMSKAAERKKQKDFNKKKSGARQAFDEAAEESDDEYAGLGGASDDESGDEENEHDREMIDEDTQVGKGDEVKLAKLHADRERESDEAAVSKLLKDITTGGLRRKRGAADDLDLSDEEDTNARRREAKRREFAKMRRELLKDEAVGKIAEDKRKEAFLKSIEDRDHDEEDENDFNQPETPLEDDSQDASQKLISQVQETARDGHSDNLNTQILKPTKDSQLNISSLNPRRSKAAVSQKPATLAEIRESVSFLIEEPDSQAGMIDLGLSDSEEEPEAYVNLDRHLQQADADEDDENDDLGDFVVDDEVRNSQTEDPEFKKPELPSKGRDRAPFSERRTKATNVVDRLDLLRQASSSSAGSNASGKMAFFSAKSGSGNLTNVPSLLRRATTNSSLGTVSGRDNVSATGVTTSKTERGSATQEKEFVRKGANTARNAINYQGRQNLKEEKMSARAGIAKKQQQHKKKSGSFLTGLFRGDTWN